MHIYRGLLWLLLIGVIIRPSDASELVFCAGDLNYHFDPAVDSSDSQSATFSTIYNRLVKFSGDQIIPDLARSWDVSDDRLEFTFHLRPGAAFHDFGGGDVTVTADDVVFSLQRQLDEAQPYYKYANEEGDSDASYWFSGLLKSMEKVDDLTVKFTLLKPDEATFLSALAQPFAAVLSSRYALDLLAKGQRGDLDRQPVGTGPFAFVEATNGASVRLRKFDRYFLGAPSIDQLTLIDAADPTARANMLAAGECQAADDPGPDRLAATNWNSDIRTLDQAQPQEIVLGFDTSSPPFDNPDARRAIRDLIGDGKVAGALNFQRAQRIDLLLPQMAVPVGSGMVASQSTTQMWNDPVELNVPEQFEVDRDYAAVLQRLKEALAEAGVPISKKSFNRNELLSNPSSPQMEGMVLWRTRGDPVQAMLDLTDCPTNPWDVTHWQNPEFESLVSHLPAATNDQQLEFFKRAQEMIYREAPIVPLVRPTVVLPYNSRQVQCLSIGKFGWPDFGAVQMGDVSASSCASPAVSIPQSTDNAFDWSMRILYPSSGCKEAEQPSPPIRFGDDGSAHYNAGGSPVTGAGGGAMPATGGGGVQSLSEMGQGASFSGGGKGAFGDRKIADLDASAVDWEILYPSDPDRTWPTFPIPSAAAVAAKEASIPATKADAEALPTDYMFIEKLKTADLVDGRVPIPYFTYGFGDEVMIKTGGSNPQLCTGTLIEGGFVLTALHCARELGSIHVVTPADEVCLGGEPTAQHPADRCRLKSLTVTGQVAKWQLDEGNEQSDGLALVPVDVSGRPDRYADIEWIYGSPKAVVTFAGFGRTREDDAAAPGRLQVSWGQIDLPFGNQTLADAGSTFSFGAVAIRGSACGGDSGGGVFQGRLFGYAGPDESELHRLVGVVLEGDSEACSEGSGAPIIAVSTQDRRVLRWLCIATGEALRICKTAGRG